jgi:hypothetical protein
MKLDLMKRSAELGKQPGEYITELIEKDLLSKAAELPEREKTFIEKQFQQFTEKLLSFFVENYDKKLLATWHYSKLSSIISRQAMYQAAQASERSKAALLQAFITEAKGNAESEAIKRKLAIIDGPIKDKITAINEAIKNEMESR